MSYMYTMYLGNIYPDFTLQLPQKPPPPTHFLSNFNTPFKK